MMGKVQITDPRNTTPLSKTFRDELNEWGLNLAGARNFILVTTSETHPAFYLMATKCSFAWDY
jgi:uncharacterized protein with ATP-grasp and redox domains